MLRTKKKVVGEDRVPRLAPGCEPLGLSLSPAEGYLLSRIDGRTPVSQLRQIAGLPPAEVEDLLEHWVKEGVVALDGDEEPPRGPCEPSPPEVTVIEEQVDPSLDISVELQRQVFDFETKLEDPYHEILGVAPDADSRVIKKAYFALSKVYHPDRYFRRNLGPFAARIERIFKRVLEAYELLSDPATREELQRSLRSAPPAPAATPSEAVPAKPERPKPFAAHNTLLEGHRRFLQQRKRKAKSMFEAGMTAFHNQRWLEAAGSVRLAIAFDPHNSAFRETFADVQRKAHDERAKALLADAETALDTSDFREALRLFEEAIYFRPFDAELHHKTASLSFQVEDDLRKAKELAMTAVEIEPEKALYRRTLGQIYKAAGLKANARRELEAAYRLNPTDKKAEAELKSL